MILSNSTQRAALVSFVRMPKYKQFSIAVKYVKIKLVGFVALEYKSVVFVDTR
jgi:hypothetical protein